jgi:hypothetical protein
MKNIKEDIGAAPVNGTSGIASLNPNDPKNPPVLKKKTAKLLNVILKRKALQ